MDTQNWKRHEGKIHDSVTCSNSAGAEYAATVIGPDDEADPNAYMVFDDAALSFSFHLTCEQAVKLGQLLIAAGQDKRPVQLRPAAL